MHVSQISSLKVKQILEKVRVYKSIDDYIFYFKEGKLPNRDNVFNVSMNTPMFNINSKQSYARCITEADRWCIGADKREFWQQSFC